MRITSSYRMPACTRTKRVRANEREFDWDQNRSGHRNRFSASLFRPLSVCYSPAQRTPMDALVPPDVTAELTQILSNLVLGDNEIRSKCATPHPLTPTQYLTTHVFQRRGRRRRAPGSQTRCLSPRSHSVCHKSRHRRSGRSAMSLTFSIFLHLFYRHPNNQRVLYI